MGIVEGFCGSRARGVSIRGKFVLSRNPEYKTRGGHHVAKRSSDPPGSLPLSLSSDTGLSASCGYCCPLCPTGVSIRGKFVLSSPRG